MANTMPADDFPEEEQESLVLVKKEKCDDLQDSKPCTREIGNIIVNNPQLSQLQARNVTITVAVNSPSSSQQSDSTLHSKSPTQILSEPQSASSPTSKTEPPPIDHSSICGAFGWTTIGCAHLPFIMRGEARFVAVRMVESKIISKYADILPWTVFTCTNIKSYYITDNEARLLNEINGYHCEFQFGYQTFSSKDVVVRLEDTVKFYEFLETCRTKLHPADCNSVFKEQCGFVMMNCSAIPYIKKDMQKFVPSSMIYQDGMLSPAAMREKVSEWDLAYFRFLCTVANIEQRKLKVGAALCCVEELQNALGLCFEEWWPNMQFSAKNGRSLLSSPTNGVLSKWGGSLQVVQSDGTLMDNSHKLRDKVSEMQVKENVFSPFSELEKYVEMNRQVQKSPHVIATQHDLSNPVQNSSSNGTHHLFPSTTLEGLLAAPVPREYPPTFNYQTQYAGHSQMQTAMGPDINLRRHFGTQNGLSSLATSRPRPFPPPPPLVRLGEASRSNMIPSEQTVVPKQQSLYPFLRPSVSPAACPPWLARVLEPDWLLEDQTRMDPTHQHQTRESVSLPEGISRRLSSEDSCGAINLASGAQINGTNTSNYMRSSYGFGRLYRDGYDSTCNSMCRDERSISSHRGSPRSIVPGPPPHYPTPPQSSPLSVQVMECGPFSGLPDIYSTRATPNSVIDLCSPPPSPETRTAISNSPRASYMTNGSYQPHHVRLVQVDSQYVLAVNVEPHKHNSVLAAPISDVVSKFLKGTSVQSCQVLLETVFGLHLHECTSSHHEAFAKHKVPIVPGSKLVTVTDLRNYLYQLRFLLAEREQQKEKNCEDRHSEADLPLAKRWCDSGRES